MSDATLELDGNAIYAGLVICYRQEQDMTLRIDTQDTT